jgi:type I restriction enzyme S subunit
MSYELLQDCPSVFRVGSRLLQDRLDAGFFRPQYAKFDAAISNLSYDVVEIRSKRATALFTHMPGFSKDKWVEYVPEGIPYLLQINVQEGYIEPSGWQYITPLAHANLKTSSLKPGDVLLTATGMHYGKAAVVPEWLKTANACPDIFRMVLKEKIDPYYIAAYLNCEYGQIELRRHGSGANRPRVITEYARKVRLVLPLQPVQEYIGAKVRLAERSRYQGMQLLDEAKSDVVTLIEENIGIRSATLDNLYKQVSAKPEIGWMDPKLCSSRLDAFHYRPAYAQTVVKLRSLDFDVQPLNKVSRKIKTGATPTGAQFVENGIPFIRSTDLLSPFVDLNSCVHITLSDHQAQLGSAVQPGDVLVSVAGTLGAVGVVPKGVNAANTNQNVARLRFSQERCDSYYLALFLCTEFGKNQVEQNATRTVQSYINSTNLGKVRVAVPPKPVQMKIGDRARLAESLLSEAAKLIREAKADVEALIEGRLDVEGIVAGRVQPPTWEDVEA